MQKEYKAKSHVSLNVTLPNGKNTHVSFEALTGGSSVYVTSNPMIQQGLESHPKFGRLFKLVNVRNEEIKAEKPAKPVELAKTNTKTIDVPSLEDAKAYLVETFGISRTKLRSRKQIEDAAAANGVEFNFA